MNKILVLIILSSLAIAQVKPKAPTSKVPPFKATVGTISNAAGTVHFVTLGSCVDTASGVTFNFYRGNVQGGESTTPLNASPLSTCNYVDNGLPALTTFFYYAKAFCQLCSTQLSLPSNEVTATTPADGQPPPPTGLTVGPIANNQVPLFWNAPVPEVGTQVRSYSIWVGTKPNLPAPGKIATVLVPTTNYMARGCVPVAPATTCTRYYEVKANDVIAGLKVVTAPSNIVKAVTP